MDQCRQRFIGGTPTKINRVTNVICTPNLGQINLRFGVFFMRFSKEDKINMYHMYQKGYGYSEVKKYYSIDPSDFYYLVRVLDRYGISWLDKPRHKWTVKEKKKAIDRVLINHESYRDVALDLGLPSSGMVGNWIRDYRKNGYNVINRPIGRPRKKTITKHNQKKINIKDKKIKELEKELLYLRAENAYLKALRELAINDQKKRK